MQKQQISCAVCTALLATLAGSAWAQPATPPAPQNVVQLSADGSVEVQQDLLVLTLDTTRDGKDANTVQAQVREALDRARMARAGKSTAGRAALNWCWKGVTLPASHKRLPASTA